jgi:L-asparaginase
VAVPSLSPKFLAYEVGKKALKAGVIPVSNMTVEAAVTKLMRVLGRTTKPKRVKLLIS